MRIKSWNDSKLKQAVSSSVSIRQVIEKLGLRPAGGNYVQVKRRMDELDLPYSHFTGSRWIKGTHIRISPITPLDRILVKNSSYQSYKLKHRLFKEKILTPECEICHWSKKASDGRIPVELDHINGIRTDNRLENLRILCPNCHSLQSTHRGLNKHNNARVVKWYTRNT